MVTPRIIIHGGAGNITRDNLPPASYALYQTALLRILSSSHDFLLGKHPDSKSPASAIDAAAYAVSLLELDGLFNCAHGAVFTKDGTNELEASIMVSRGYKKRGAAVSMLKHVKSPITLAKELLKKGEEEDNGGAQGHVHISGPEAERLAKEWGCDIVDQSYFWTRKRWEQHKGGLEGIEPPPSPPEDGDDDDDEVRSLEGSARGSSTSTSKATPVDKRPDGSDWPYDDPAWDGREYIPKGTVGCVVLDADGVLAVATSTGGLTNKLSGRIGDTPTFGAGFWAEEWVDSLTAFQPKAKSVQATGLAASVAKYVPNSPLASLAQQFSSFGLGKVRDCFASAKSESPSPPQASRDEKRPCEPLMRGVALGGTGNGDSFLRLSAASTVASLVKFGSPRHSLQAATSWMAGSEGQLQRSAGPRWGGKMGEGEGGLIGIELVEGKGKIVWGFNRAMFRAWIDEEGEQRIRVFEEDY